MATRAPRYLPLRSPDEPTEAGSKALRSALPVARYLPRLHSASLPLVGVVHAASASRRPGHHARRTASAPARRFHQQPQQAGSRGMPRNCSLAGRSAASRWGRPSAGRRAAMAQCVGCPTRRAPSTRREAEAVRPTPGAQVSTWRRCRGTKLERAGLARDRPPQNGTRLEHQTTLAALRERPSSSDEPLSPRRTTSIPPGISRAPREIATKLLPHWLCWAVKSLPSSQIQRWAILGSNQ